MLTGCNSKSEADASAAAIVVGADPPAPLDASPDFDSEAMLHALVYFIADRSHCW